MVGSSVAQRNAVDDELTGNVVSIVDIIPLEIIRYSHNLTAVKARESLSVIENYYLHNYIIQPPTEKSSLLGIFYNNSVHLHFLPSRRFDRDLIHGKVIE